MNASATDPVERTAYITCVLCEASCGLEVKLRDEQIESIRGHEGDPLSRGHICPKAIALQDIHADPDRLRKAGAERGLQLGLDVGRRQGFILIARCYVYWCI